MATDIDLGKQIGPLPLGAWIAVVGGGLGIALWSRNRGNAEPPEEMEDGGGIPGVGEGDGSRWLDLNKPPGDSDKDPEYDTNEAWGRAAINWLIAQGYSPGLASSAITKALAGGQDISGNKMSQQEWSLWVLALTKFGSPPQPVNVAPPSSVPGPVTPSPKPPVVKPPVDNKPPVVEMPNFPRPLEPKPPNMGKPKPPGAKPGPGRYATWTISPANRTLSALVAAHNRKHHERLTVDEVWNYNLKWRNERTKKLMRERGKNKVFIGTTFWMPY